jgi:murein DD-endopeptidase MepM/ murein hydrolase activator NlpD
MKGLIVGRSTNDIVSRIILNGAQFSSETDRIFGQLRAGARASAADLKQEFVTAYQQIEQIAQRAVSVPRTATGSLSIDVAGARQAAAAAEAEAIALREVANAAERVAKQKGVLNEANSAQIMGMRAAADAAEAHARAMVQQANFADLLQTELNQTASAIDTVVTKNRLLNVSTGAAGQRSVQASQQFQDFFIQVQGGGNVAVAAAMQISQLAYVMNGAGGIAGRVASVLAGPYGAAILGGVTLLAMFIPQIIKSGDALEEESRKLEENAKKTDIMEQAKTRYAQTTRGLIEAIRKTTEEIDRQNRTFEQNIRLQEDAARKQLATARDQQANVAMNLLQAKQQLADARQALEMQKVAARRPTQAGEVAAMGLPGAQARVDALESRVKDLQGQMGALTTEIGNAERNLFQGDVERAKRAADHVLDPIKRITDAYADLRKEAEQTITSRDALTKRLIALGVEEERALKRERERQKLDKEDVATGRESRARIMSPVSGPMTSGFGARSRPTAGASTFHAGVDYAVPVGTAVRSGAPGIVVHAGRLGALGNAVVIDYGDRTIAKFGHLSDVLVKPGDRVSAGQTVARSGNTGVSTGPHLHYSLEVNGRPVDPRNRSVRQGAGEKAATEAARELADQRKKEADQYDRIMAASQRQLDVDAEGLRIVGLKVRGLDEQAAVEAEIARQQREHAERMAELAELDRKDGGDRVGAAKKVREEVIRQADALKAQGDAYAKLIEQAGDQTNLTADQLKTLDEANAALITQLEAARALAKTDGERLAISMAIARVNARLGAAEGVGRDRARDEKRVAEEVERDREKSDSERAERQRDQIYSLANFYRDAFRDGNNGIVENFKDEMLDVISEVAARWTIALLSGQKTSLGSILSDMGATSGVGGGGLLGSLLGALGGGKKAGATSLLPGIGDLAAAKSGAGGLLGGLGGIGSAISAAVPYAAIAAVAIPLISSVFGSLFRRAPTGTAIMSNGTTTIGGNNADARKAVGSTADSVNGSLNRIAQSLGAEIGNFTVSIGKREDYYRVSGSGSSRVGEKHPNTPLLYNGTDAQEAMRIAVQDAIRDGAIQGISAASQAILKSGQDIEKAIEKALLIEDVPKRLQSKLDPVGFAIDQFNKQWDKTIAALIEGGASAEEMARAQRLYKIELAETKEAAREASTDLKEFLNGLNFGGGSPYSLRDQERIAADALKPFEEAILKGERIDQGKYTDAAQTYLDLQRELYGSTGKFFEAMDRVQSLTGKAISDIDNAKPIRVETDPFLKVTASSSQATAEILAHQLPRLYDAMQENNRLLGGLSGGDGFFADHRSFVA